MVAVVIITDPAMYLVVLTYKAPPIPTPPTTVKAPVVVLILDEVLVIVNISGDVTKVWVTVVYCITNLVALIVPPTFKSPPIPTPPTTVKAPVLVDVDA